MTTGELDHDVGEFAEWGVRPMPDDDADAGLGADAVDLAVKP